MDPVVSTSAELTYKGKMPTAIYPAKVYGGIFLLLLMYFIYCFRGLILISRVTIGLILISRVTYNMTSP